MKISFDFDSTLSRKDIQEMAKIFIKSGHDVFITTSRPEFVDPKVGWNNDILFEIADSVGIKQERIRFTSYVDKFEFLEDFDIHFDDDIIEIELINEHLPNCKAILIK
jgi:hypothetical protein